MSLSRFALLLVLVWLGPDLDPRCQVRLGEGRVLVNAKAVPLEDVLTRFSEVTGAKIVYGTSRPRQVVSVDIDAASEAEAVAQLLEGQQIGYALRLDKSGKHVETVLLTATGGEGAPPPVQAEEAAAPPEPPEGEPGEADPEEAVKLAEEPAEAGAEASDLPPMLVQPPAGKPDEGAPAAGAPAEGGGGATPTTTPESPRPAASAPPGVAAPWLPAPASYPVPASYPAPAPVVIPPGN